jgi:Ca2+-binding EF-hand superfamily protein
MKITSGMLMASLSLLPFATSAADVTDAQIESAFEIANPDKDGTVDMKEAAKFGISEKAFKAANPDNDGTLDKKEFAAAIAAQFKAANPDNDGTLDEKEAMAAGVKSKKAFKEANPDNDGTVDMSEYLTALTMQAKGSK